MVEWEYGLVYVKNVVVYCDINNLEVRSPFYANWLLVVFVFNFL